MYNRCESERPTAQTHSDKNTHTHTHTSIPHLTRTQQQYSVSRRPPPPPSTLTRSAPRPALCSTGHQAILVSRRLYDNLLYPPDPASRGLAHVSNKLCVGELFASGADATARALHDYVGRLFPIAEAFTSALGARQSGGDE